MKTLSMTLFSSMLASGILLGASLSETSANNSLIVYNSNIALVHEDRELNLNKEEDEIIYEGVAPSIETDSVNIELPNGVTLFSQQYRFDKLTQKKLLDAHIGKSVDAKVMRDSVNFEIIKATLLSNDGSRCIVKSGEGDILALESKDIIFKSIPNELITKPSLVWNVKSKKDIKSNMSIDYLISGVSWKGDYILNLKKDKADLSGWITIENRSGKSFNNTKLHVLAGDINRIKDEREKYMVAKTMAMMSDAAPEVAHQAHEGYHFYTIPFRVNLSNNEKTQIKFISQNGIDIKRKYTATMSYPHHLSGESEHDLTQHAEMKGFDYPLPKGVVRSYSKLKDTNILLGESSLKHTPKNTPVSLKTGKNFDIKIKEILLKKDDTKWKLDADIKYIVKNSSDEIKTIEILVPFNKNSTSTIRSDEKYNFTKGNLVTFEIIVKAGATKEFIVNFKTDK